MNATDRKFVEDLIDARTADCKDCQRGRAERRKADQRRRGVEILAMPASDRVAALRAMTHAARVAAIGGVDLDCAIDLVRDAGPDDLRMVLGVLAPAVACNVVVWTIPLVKFFKVRNAELEGSRTSPCEITAEQRERLVACGYGGLTSNHRGVWHWKGWPLGTHDERTGAVHAERSWTWSADQLAILQDVDRDLADKVATSKLVVEPLSERECRALMGQG